MKQKILISLGTRPEIIRLSRIIFKLKQAANVVVVNTNQNFDPKLNENFLKELDVHIDHNLNARGTFSEQCAGILMGIEHIITQEQPHKFLVLGDTNSGLGAIIAKKMGIPVFHLEAGNRCYDDKVPEEINRRIIDHSSDILMPYTERAKENLITEGISRQRIYIIGNPIYEVIKYYVKKEEIVTHPPKPYYLITLHRSENVDNLERFANFLHLFRTFAETHKDSDVIISTHPHTRLNMKKMGIVMDTMPENLIFSEPFGFSEFITLEKKATMVFTDSGTVQEECAILNVPNMTLRTTTERPETIESGSCVLMNQDFDLMNNEYFQTATGSPPSGYLDKNVSDKVVRIVLGHYNG